MLCNTALQERVARVSPPNALDGPKNMCRPTLSKSALLHEILARDKTYPNEEVAFE